MSKKSSSAEPVFDDDTFYDLILSRPITVGRFKYLPRHKIKTRGLFIKKIIEEQGADVIQSANAR